MEILQKVLESKRGAMGRYTGEEVLTIHTQVNSSDTKQKVKESNYLRFKQCFKWRQNVLESKRGAMERYTGEKVLTIHSSKQLRHKTESERDQLSSI